eukprot:c8185_g1_i1.p1 GENE.c8185_g1_i1~~c8185_g1_i1.p1  ORF type:complete len:250 (-),score=33.34 c8185_g1_i1:78-827(-)
MSHVLEPEHHDVESGSHLCIVCVEKPIEIRLPCGHAVLCEDCVKKLKETTTACPTCREVFQTYYVIDQTKPLHRESTFINPSDGVASFGSLRQFSTTNLVRNINDSRQQGNLCLGFTLLFLLFIVVLGIYAMPVALIVIGAQHLDAECDKPIPVWMILFGVNSLTQGVLSLCDKKCKGEGWYKCYTFLKNACSMTLFILGTSYVYQAKHCNNLAYDFSWYFLTISLSIAAGVLALACCVICFAPRNTQS